MTLADIAELERLFADYVTTLQHKRPRMIALTRQKLETALVKHADYLIDAAKHYAKPECAPGRICEPITLHSDDSIASQCGRCGRVTDWQVVSV
jgi:hypothetical protein